MTKEEALDICRKLCPDCPCLPNGCDTDTLEPSSGGMWYCRKCDHYIGNDIAAAFGVNEQLST